MDGSSRWASVLDAVRRHQMARLDHGELQGVLTSTMRLGISAIPGTVGCSVTQLQDDGTFATPASDGALAYDLDAAQYEVADGPCLTAARRGERQRMDRMLEDVRWPAFTARATTWGVASSLSVPLGGVGAAAALNFYGATPELYTGPRAEAISSLITRITRAFLTAPADDREVIPVMRQERAAADRAVIARAQRLVMDRYQLDEARAYRYLADRSSDEGLPLADVAHQVADSPEAPQIEGPGEQS